MKIVQTLDEREIIKQIEILRNRIAERFPTRELLRTAANLLDVSRVSAKEAASLRDRYWGLRLISMIVIGGGVCLFYKLFYVFYDKVNVGGAIPLPDLAQGLEATLNIMLICGIILLFFWQWEKRAKRRKALNGLYQLRAIAHVVDMHQLTKDPEPIAGKARTSSSPIRDLTQEQLLRYLDYCAEMLSLIGKLAALYAQYFPDSVVISAVNDIEELTTNLSRKIWQKIMLTQPSQRVA
jgi:hypothetical protein